jgi:hypothetical protein
MALPDWVLIGGVVVSAVGSLALAVKARPEARKMDREGGAAAIAAGGGIVTQVHDEMKELRAELREFRTWRKGLETRLRKHSRWDDQMTADARAQGRVVPDPPPLWDDENGTAA